MLAPPMKIMETTTTIMDLTKDLLAEILKRSSSIGYGGGGPESHKIFSSVCSSWRSVAAKNPYCKQPPPPLLILSKLKKYQKKRYFFGFEDKQIHEIEFSTEANSSWCSGSSEGWMVMTHKKSGNFLYNPITRDRINLPPHDGIVPKVAYLYDDGLHLRGQHELFFWFEDPIAGLVVRPKSSMYLTKAIVVTTQSLSSDSSSPPPLNHHDDIVAVAAIFDQHQFIGFCRPGDKEWQVYTHPHVRKPEPDIPVEYIYDIDALLLDQVIGDDDYTAEHEYSTENPPKFADIILHRGALYAITQHTALVGVFKFDNSSGTSRVIPEIQWLNIQPMKLRMAYEDWNYLVESCDGELLMVVRRRRDARGGTKDGQRSVRTWRFLVFKLDEFSDPMRWVRIKSLGDQILFLGINHSKSFRASHIPGAGSGNCIYFTTDLTWRHLCVMMNCWPSTGNSYTCTDTGVFYLEDERVESSSSFFTDGRTLSSTLEYPAVFITPNPSSSSSPFTITYDSYISSKYRQRYAEASAFVAAVAAMMIAVKHAFKK